MTNEKPKYKEGDMIVFDNTLMKIVSIDREDFILEYEVEFIAGNPKHINILSIPTWQDDKIELYTSQKYDVKKFYPYDKVLVREFNFELWKCDFFSHINHQGLFVTTSGTYVQCIPYESNKDLVGTSLKANDFYVK